MMNDNWMMSDNWYHRRVDQRDGVDDWGGVDEWSSMDHRVGVVDHGASVGHSYWGHVRYGHHRSDHACLRESDEGEENGLEKELLVK